MLIWSFALHNAHPTPGGGIGPSGPGLGAAAAAALGSVSSAGTAGTAPVVVHGSQPPHRPHALCALGECGGTAGTTLSVWGRVVTVPSMATGARKWGRGGVPGRAERLAMGPGAAGPRVLLGVTAAVGGPLFKDPSLHVYILQGSAVRVWVCCVGLERCWAMLGGDIGQCWPQCLPLRLHSGRVCGECSFVPRERQRSARSVRGERRCRGGRWGSRGGGRGPRCALSSVRGARGGGRRETSVWEREVPQGRPRGAVPCAGPSSGDAVPPDHGCGVATVPVRRGRGFVRRHGYRSLSAGCHGNGAAGAKKPRPAAAPNAGNRPTGSGGRSRGGGSVRGIPGALGAERSTGTPCWG